MPSKCILIKIELVSNNLWKPEILSFNPSPLVQHSKKKIGKVSLRISPKQSILARRIIYLAKLVEKKKTVYHQNIIHRRKSSFLIFYFRFLFSENDTKNYEGRCWRFYQRPIKDYTSPSKSSANVSSLAKCLAISYYV